MSLFKAQSLWKKVPFWRDAEYRGRAYSTVLSSLFDPVGRIRHNHEAAGRTSKLKSNDYNLLNINILYLCDCSLLKSEVVQNVYVHATFDKFYPSSVTNCHTSRTSSP